MSLPRKASPASKNQAAPAPKPARPPWRSFKVGVGPGYASIVEGHGTTLEDAVTEAVEEIRMLSSRGIDPDDHVIIEQDRVVCRVLAADVTSELGWLATCDAEDDARAKAAKARADPVPAAKAVVTADTHAPKPFSPADLPETILALARLELRDAIDALLNARSRCNGAHRGMNVLTMDAQQIAKSIDQRAYNLCTESEDAIAKSLLTVWGIYKGEVQPIGTTPPPWTPCGALVDDRYFAWVIPGEIHGRPDYRVITDRVRVVDSEALEEDNLSDDDWDRLLERPPCRYVILHGSKPPLVIDPECHVWH